VWVIKKIKDREVSKTVFLFLGAFVPDPCHFGTDQDPTKIIIFVFCLFLFQGTFT
jgi:hypothetical protein